MVSKFLDRCAWRRLFAAQMERIYNTSVARNASINHNSKLANTAEDVLAYPSIAGVAAGICGDDQIALSAVEADLNARENLGQ